MGTKLAGIGFGVAGSGIGLVFAVLQLGGVTVSAEAMLALLIPSGLMILGGGALIVLGIVAKGGQEANVWRQLDSACIYVMKVEGEIELATAGRQVVRPPFSPPPDAPGGYGPLSNPEARRAFVKLQELGVIEPTGLFDERGNIVYRWTDLGGRVLKRL